MSELDSLSGSGPEKIKTGVESADSRSPEQEKVDAEKIAYKEEKTTIERKTSDQVDDIKQEIVTGQIEGGESKTKNDPETKNNGEKKWYEGGIEKANAGLGAVGTKLSGFLEQMKHPLAGMNTMITKFAEMFSTVREQVALALGESIVSLEKIPYVGTTFAPLTLFIGKDRADFFRAFSELKIAIPKNLKRIQFSEIMTNAAGIPDTKIFFSRIAKKMGPGKAFNLEEFKKFAEEERKLSLGVNIPATPTPSPAPSPTVQPAPVAAPNPYQS